MRLFTEGSNGTLIPVKNWAAFAEKKGLEGAISLVEILPIAQALKEAYMAFEQIKGQIYELTGISDIIRGQTQASETATAQKIKNNYASMRLKTYQDEVERFAERLLNLKAQIICKHFDAQTICQISGCEQLSPEDQQYIPPSAGTAEGQRHPHVPHRGRNRLDGVSGRAAGQAGRQRVPDRGVGLSGEGDPGSSRSGTADGGVAQVRRSLLPCWKERGGRD
jgi:hypothetical protein